MEGRPNEPRESRSFVNGLKTGGLRTVGGDETGRSEDNEEGGDLAGK